MGGVYTPYGIESSYTQFASGVQVGKPKIENSTLSAYQLLAKNPGLFFNLFIGIVHSLTLSTGFTGIPSYDNKRKDIGEKYKPLPPLLELSASFIFLWWGLGWWKGLYFHPCGIGGYILATASVIVGIVLCLIAIERLT
jgi:hypothetical protein